MRHIGMCRARNPGGGCTSASAWYIHMQSPTCAPTVHQIGAASASASASATSRDDGCMAQGDGSRSQDDRCIYTAPVFRQVQGPCIQKALGVILAPANDASCMHMARTKSLYPYDFFVTQNLQMWQVQTNQSCKTPQNGMGYSPMAGTAGAGVPAGLHTVCTACAWAQGRAPALLQELRLGRGHRA